MGNDGDRLPQMCKTNPKPEKENRNDIQWKVVRLPKMRMPTLPLPEKTKYLVVSLDSKLSLKKNLEEKMKTEEKYLLQTLGK